MISPRLGEISVPQFAVAVTSNASRRTPILVRFEMRVRDRMDRVVETVLAGEIQHEPHDVIALHRVSALDVA